MALILPDLWAGFKSVLAWVGSGQLLGAVQAELVSCGPAGSPLLLTAAWNE